MSEHDKALFKPVKLGAIELPNRVIMAPLTRTRASEGHVPNDLMADYYAQRASGGLLIAECTMVMPSCSSFMREPGIHSDEQVEGWKKVTDAVHAKGGRIFLQIWHGGRTCHPDLNEGKQPVSASAIAIKGDETHTPEGKKPYTEPRALADEEIPDIIAGFRKAAENAKKAGFDGVEVHGANGYLMDQFLRESSNKREAPYGGSLENRAKLMMQVLEAAIDVWGSDRVGLRLSQLNGFNDMKDDNPMDVLAYLCKTLNKYDLAYLHVMRADFRGEQQGDVVGVCNAHYKGNLIANMGYDAEEANNTINDGQAAAIAFGVPFLANPDLPERFAANAELNEPRPDLFYTHEAEGYNDYPFMEK